MNDKGMKTDDYFLRVALAARSRGFPVTPLRDKRPFLPAWNRQPLTTETEIRTAAKEYPTCDVGLVMKRKVGEPFAIDVDSPGVIERLERETQMTLPETYTVLSRPVTAPYKRHIFFRHTEYSNRVFTKNVNAGEYDLIGVGVRALQVVSEVHPGAAHGPTKIHPVIALRAGRYRWTSVSVTPWSSRSSTCWHAMPRSTESFPLSHPNHAELVFDSECG